MKKTRRKFLTNLRIKAIFKYTLDIAGLIHERNSANFDRKKSEVSGCLYSVKKKLKGHKMKSEILRKRRNVS